MKKPGSANSRHKRSLYPVFRQDEMPTPGAAVLPSLIKPQPLWDSIPAASLKTINPHIGQGTRYEASPSMQRLPVCRPGPQPPEVLPRT